MHRIPELPTAPPSPVPPLGRTVATIAGRRLALTIRTPRELAVPLLTPVLFAIVIAPALNDAVGGARPGGSTTRRSSPPRRSACSSR